MITIAVVDSATTRGAAAVVTWVLLPYISDGLGSPGILFFIFITLVTWKCMEIKVAEKVSAAVCSQVFVEQV